MAVSDWPTDGKLYLPGLESKIKSARILNPEGSDITVNYKQEKDQWVVFDIPFKAPEKLISIIELKFKNGSEITANDEILGIYPNTETELITEFGEVINAEQKNIRWMEKFGEWKHANQVSNWKENGSVTWNINVQKPGYYYVNLKYAGANRLVWKISTDENVTVQNQQAATEKYVSYNMGILEFKKPGKHTISVSLVEGDITTSSLKSIILVPIVN